MSPATQSYQVDWLNSSTATVALHKEKSSVFGLNIADRKTDGVHDLRLLQAQERRKVQC